MLEGRKIVTEEEVKRKAIRASLKVLKLELIDVDTELIEDVTCSFVECPISLKSLHFSERVRIGDVTFYHLHTEKPERDDFELAYMEYLQSKTYLDSFDVLVSTTDRFFDGYERKGKYLREYIKDDKRYVVFYSTISDVYEDINIHLSLNAEVEGEYAVVVHTERELGPFLKFFKMYSEDVKRAGMKIWVVNPKAKVIDPFIGYPKDFKLLSRFNNPKAAAMISSYWRVNVRELN